MTPRFAIIIKQIDSVVIWLLNLDTGMQASVQKTEEEASVCASCVTDTAGYQFRATYHTPCRSPSPRSLPTYGYIMNPWSGWGCYQHGTTCSLCLGDCWSSWTEWGACSATCNRGTQDRVRVSISRMPCEGENVQFQPCMISACPGKLGWYVFTCRYISAKSQVRGFMKLILLR